MCGGRSVPPFGLPGSVLPALSSLECAYRVGTSVITHLKPCILHVYSSFSFLLPPGAEPQNAHDRRIGMDRMSPLT